MKLRQWKLAKNNTTDCESLCAQTKLPAIVVELLASRGYDTPEKIQDFLALDSTLSDPFALKDMDRAVTRIMAAIEHGQQIAVYGDYDCDGILATVLLYLYLEAVGANVSYYIPSRKNDGYGLSKRALKLIKKNHINLVITVDNGISAIEEAEYAKELGLDLVITDHHKPREMLPEAAAIVNPHREDDASGLEYLAGVGVAFKLISAMEGDLTGELLEQYGDLVAVATVGDIVPLVGENRLILSHGIDRIENTDNLGMRALLEVCALADKSLTSENLAYGLVPRINAAGRFDMIDKVVELFITDDEDNALSLAKELNGFNNKRKELEAVITQDIQKTLEASPKLLYDRILVISGEGWHNGVIGIVAAKLVERYGKPCILFSIENGEARGSCRSVEGFSIIDAIDSCRSLITRYGGHTMAAGLTVAEHNLSEFTQAIQEYARKTFSVMPVGALKADRLITIKELTVETISALSVLEPFGCGNDAPTFIIEKVEISGIYPIGEGKHLRLRLTDRKESFFAVYFGVTADRLGYAVGDVVDLLAAVEVNEYQNEKRVSVKVRDIHLHKINYEEMAMGQEVYDRFQRDEPLEPRQKQYALPGRNEIAAVYRYIRGHKQVGYDLPELYLRVGCEMMNYSKLLFIVDILLEMGLVKLEQTAQMTVISVVAGTEKVDINQSRIIGLLTAHSSE